MSKYFSLLIIFLFLAGCGSAPTFNVKSDPLQADIYYVDNTSGEKKPLGKTPFSMTLDEVKNLVKNVNAGEFFTLSVEKEGYIPQNFVIPATNSGLSVLELDVKMKTGQMAEEKKKAKEILDQLFLAQKFALTQQYERAQLELDKVLASYPDFSNAMSMRAAIYFAQKNYGESIKWYENAIKADPKMEDAVKMLAKVKAAQSGRQPASEPNNAK